MNSNPNIRNFSFTFAGAPRTIIGGPYRNRPITHFGIKMAEEINTPFDISIPTRDFSVPKVSDLDKGMRGSLLAIARNEPIYCGCMGGIGRTGLFFGALMTALGEKNPVAYVRANYKGHAIETDEQQDLVNNYKPSLSTKLTLEVAKVVSLFY